MRGGQSRGMKLLGTFVLFAVLTACGGSSSAPATTTRGAVSSSAPTTSAGASSTTGAAQPGKAPENVCKLVDAAAVKVALPDATIDQDGTTRCVYRTPANSVDQEIRLELSMLKGAGYKDVAEYEAGKAGLISQGAVEKVPGIADSAYWNKLNAELTFVKGERFGSVEVHLSSKSADFNKNTDKTKEKAAALAIAAWAAPQV